MNDLIARLTSRKFALALASGVFGVLASTGIVPADAVARDATIAAPLLFIAVEGVADMIERHQLAAATVHDAYTASLEALAALQAPNALATSPGVQPAPAV